MELQVQDVVLYGVFTLVLGWLLHLINRWMNPACNGRLPPGSLGLPIVGETLQLLKSSPSLDIPDFYKLRLKRYGHLFKTSLIVKPVVVSMDMEYNRFVFRHNDKLFQLWYLDKMNSIFGKKIISECYGSNHKYFRNLAAPLYAPKNLKEGFVSEMESIITESLRTWAANPNIEVKEAMTDEEHDAILEKREVVNSRITWEEFKYMKFTNQVINEMVRVSSHGPGIFRKTLKDVHVNGYTIPEGWLVLVSPMAVHLNPLIFEDPLTFNPWRWQINSRSGWTIKEIVQITEINSRAGMWRN
ncbi:hypothetical protein C2845_PM03G23030 [Panicum miliaceum]|uniref:Uncharacterized protein n=1 Tax=Panicum miliaceum TaxID=4540 RepID=A0A3L6TA06_PANMI|nr:hypothetical protein C2845_PM03G23030 [Panicum miliaceum]